MLRGVGLAPLSHDLAQGRDAPANVFPSSTREGEAKPSRGAAVDKELRAEAHMIISLSAMTLPHQLTRLILWEQLFRATHILGGGSYHRSSIG